MAIFNAKKDEVNAAEIERLSSENERLSREVERMSARVKSLEQEAATADLRRIEAAQILEQERREFDRKRKALEQAYNRVKMQRDKLRIGNKADPL